jgi:hypothetical protein
LNKPTVTAHHDALRGLITLGQIDAADILTIQYGGKLPVRPELNSQYHQLHGPVHITWQEMDPALSHGYLHEHGSRDSIEIDSTLNAGSDDILATAVGQAMIRSLLDRTIILVPDECAPRTPLQKYFGFEMDETLALGESADERQLREMDMPNWRSGLGRQFEKTEILLRFHNIMVARAHHAGRIAETRAELYAALCAESLSPSAKVKKMLQETIAGEEGVKVFGPYQTGLSAHNFDRAVIDFAKGLSSLKPDQQERFWEDVAPAYYGDLLTLYGHINGRGSMDVFLKKG